MRVLNNCLNVLIACIGIIVFFADRTICDYTYGVHEKSVVVALAVLYILEYIMSFILSKKQHVSISHLKYIMCACILLGVVGVIFEIGDYSLYGSVAVIGLVCVSVEEWLKKKRKC